MSRRQYGLQFSVNNIYPVIVVTNTRIFNLGFLQLRVHGYLLFV